MPYGGGIPACTVAQTIPVPFNDADALDARLSELPGQVACVIMEPGMMNIGVVLPQDGYLAAVREVTRKHNVLLIFDEVKTGITIAAGGAVERWGVTPDIVTLAKALGGGLPSGAIGGSEEVMASIESGLVYQVGTFNGNPLSMAAARASLLEVMTPDAYVHLEHLNARLHDGPHRDHRPATASRRTWSASAPRAASCSRPSRSSTTATGRSRRTARSTSLRGSTT